MAIFHLDSVRPVGKCQCLTSLAVANRFLPRVGQVANPGL